MRNVIVGAALVVSAAVTPHAQQGSAQAVRTARLSVTPVAGQTVKGAPYAAEVVTEAAQTLADGNRIVQKTTGRVYRDSEGRVRREDDRRSDGPTVSITDPVAGKAYTLDPATRTARETPQLVVLNLAATLSTVKAAVDELAARGGGRTARTGGAGSGGGGAAVGSRGGRGVARTGAIVEETLPDRMIEGVRATGVRKTTTIAAGAIGNERPIVVVSEEWTSPDLQVLVLTDHNDPRTGRSTYRLLQIDRTEPDPTLFRVPADYTIQPMRGGRGRGGRGGE